MINHNDFLNADDKAAEKMLCGLTTTQIVSFYNALVPMAVAAKAKPVKTFHDKTAALARVLWLKGDINACIASAVVREMAEELLVNVSDDCLGVRPIMANERSVDYPTLSSAAEVTVVATTAKPTTKAVAGSADPYKLYVMRFTAKAHAPQSFRGHRANIWSVLKDGMTVGEFIKAAKPVKGGIGDVRIYLAKGLVTLEKGGK